MIFSTAEKLRNVTCLWFFPTTNLEISLEQADRKHLAHTRRVSKYIRIKCTGILEFLMFHIQLGQVQVTVATSNNKAQCYWVTAFVAIESHRCFLSWHQCHFHKSPQISACKSPRLISNSPPTERTARQRGESWTPLWREKVQAESSTNKGRVVVRGMYTSMQPHLYCCTAWLRQRMDWSWANTKPGTHWWILITSKPEC